MARVLKTVHLKFLDTAGTPVDIEDINLSARLKERYREIQMAKEEINAQPSLDESEEFEKKLNSEEFTLALQAKKSLGNSYKITFHEDEVVYPFSFRLMADYGPALTWLTGSGMLGEQNRCHGSFIRSILLIRWICGSICSE